MNRRAFLAALETLPDAEFQHIMVICVDAAKRLPEHQFKAILETVEDSVTPIEYTPPDTKSEVAEVNLVKVSIMGTEAEAEKGGLG